MTILKWAMIFLAGLAVVMAVAWFAGRHRWEGLTRALLDDLEAARRAPAPARVDGPAFDALPPVVQRYFRATLGDGTRTVAALTIEHAGTFNLSESGEAWRAFTSRQRVIVARPGFAWDARIAMLPGLAVHVHDAYVQGKGILRPAIGGWFDLTHLEGRGDIAEGELLRFLAEAAWYPTALLPAAGVRWQAIDEHSARVTLTDDELAVSMTFGFGPDGFVVSARAEARGRMVGGESVPTPWEGTWSAYRDVQGLRVPMAGEVAWILSTGERRPYWRGRVLSLDYEFAP